MHFKRSKSALDSLKKCSQSIREETVVGCPCSLMAALTQHKTKDTKTRKLIKLQMQHVPQALLIEKAL